MNLAISSSELLRAHTAAKLIEEDAHQAFRTCCERFGRDVAVALLVAFFRRVKGSMDSYPSPENVVPAVNTLLEELNLVRESCPTCGR
jgi:hypothetical protein